MYKPEPVLLVANYEPHVGYAWNYIAKFWTRWAQHAPCHIAYPLKGVIPNEIIEHKITPHIQSMRQLVGSVRLIRDKGIRTIYLTDWPPLHPLYAVWRLFGVKTILIHDHVPGDQPPASPIKRKLKRLFHSLQVLSADQYIGVAEHVRQRLVNTACVDPSRTVTVSNGIEPFNIEPDVRASIRTELGIPDHHVIILMVGRASAYKNFKFANEFAKIYKWYLQCNHVHFVHCGDGPELYSLQQQSNGYGISDRMHWLGHRSDVRKLMMASDVFFHPSKGEAMSLSLLEAACAELPIIVPDTPSVSFTVEHGVTGFKYKTGDYSSMFKQLVNLVDVEQRKKMRIAARKNFLEQYTFDKTMYNFDKLIQSVI